MPKPVMGVVVFTVIFLVDLGLAKFIFVFDLNKLGKYWLCCDF